MYRLHINVGLRHRRIDLYLVMSISISTVQAVIKSTPSTPQPPPPKRKRPPPPHTHVPLQIHAGDVHQTCNLVLCNSVALEKQGEFKNTL
jgi:hypothetical protein